MGETLTIDFSKPLPLFPLPNCVLLPHATIPLHIFEPRYRQMTKDALDSRGLIAVATFEGDDWKTDYENNPPLRPFVCVGYIVRHDRLADGRYNMLLQGICRARITGEVPYEPYRLALVEPAEVFQSMEIDLTDQRDRLEDLLGDPLLKQLSCVSAIHNWLSKEIPTNVLVDLAIMTVCDDVDRRYAMLSETNAGSRAAWLEHNLRQTRRTLALATRHGSGQSPEGFNLN